MSLYTPVFPLTDQPVTRASSSSSLTSNETHKQAHGLSYSSRLSQWHLAIASLPYELSPPSAPASPSSQERSANLQAEIERAVHEGRNITDFCNLRSTKLGYATKQHAHNSIDQGDGIPWILAETEEEWFEWEREMARRRIRQKGEKRMNQVPPPRTQKQNPHDKVLNWKAGLQPPGSTPVTASPATTASSARSSLGFPVVKRSTVKDNKLKVAKPSTPPDSTPRPDIESLNNGERDAALRVDTRAMNAVHVDTDGVDHSKTPSEVKHVMNDPPSEAKGEVLLPEEPQNDHLGFDEFIAFPPPSFPSDLVTSTQKDVFGVVRSSHDPLEPFPLYLAASTLKETNNADETTADNDLREPGAEIILRPETQPLSNGPPTVPSERQIPQPTPPSPPYSSEASHPCVLQPDVPSNDEVPFIPTTPQNDIRPLTPPPEGENIVGVSSGMQSSPRTPERPRRPPSEKDVMGDFPRAGLYGGGGTMTNCHTTPDAAINGASVIPFPRTPERQRQVLTDPLTTSRKSRPRPRPPSRKQSVQNMDVDAAMDGAASEAGGINPSPAKSDRSYFSSPASGSSSGSNFSRGSMMLVPDSPTSPLGFTQNPSRFAPLAQSTQVSSGGSPRQSRRQTQKHAGLAGGSSGSAFLGMAYNSQFDVNAQVDQLSNFMRQDVDLDAWVRNTDTEEDEDDVVAVEELTRTYPGSSLGS